LFFADFIILIPFVYIFFFKIKRIRIKSIKLAQRFVVFVLLFVLSFSPVIYFLIGQYKAFPENFTKIFDNNSLEKKAGILPYHAIDAYNFISHRVIGSGNISQGDLNEVNQYFDNKAQEAGNLLFGKEKGKNLIVVQVESLQNFVVGAKINGVEITPNLNKLAGDSIYFNNFYSQTSGGNTSDAEFMMNTSLYPISQGSAYFVYPTNKYISFPHY
jgi:phosphoglycerol transferase MdoB-like AlkP superfamily enzyme